MSTNLYFLSGEKTQPMAVHLYDKEADLQKIIADNPELLIRQSVGDELLMLVKQEQAVQGTEAEATSYSLDHLFVDQDGIPVLVEVKRSTDTRIRREVVGQVIDYAARAREWDIEKLRASFMENNWDPDVQERFDNEDFWRAVETNLKAEHFRLVFAADQIPDSLRTLILFLDRNFSNIEVYGVEIQQYKTKDGTTMLTTNVIENVRAVENQSKPTHRGATWTSETFSRFLVENGVGRVAGIVESLTRFAAELGMNCVYGRGKFPSVMAKSRNITLFRISPWQSQGSYKCAFETNVMDISNILDDNWNQDRVRDLLESIPNRAEMLNDGLMWRSPQYFYINLLALESQEDLKAFKESIRQLYMAVAK